MKYFLDTEFLEGTQKKRFLSIPFGTTKPTIDLISIGIVAEDGREYYAISKEFNLEEAWSRFDLKPDINNSGMKKVYWIRENVLYPIFAELFQQQNPEVWAEEFGNIENFKGHFERIGKGKKYFKELLFKYGKTNKQIAEEIKLFTNCATLDQLEYKGIFEEQHKFQFRFSDTTWKVSTDLAKSKEEALKIIMFETENAKPDNPEFYAYYADYDWVAFCWLFGKMMDLPKGFPMYCRDLKQTFDFLNKKFIATSALNGARHYGKSIKGLKDMQDYPGQSNEHNALADAEWNYRLYRFLERII